MGAWVFLVFLVFFIWVVFVLPILECRCLCGLECVFERVDSFLAVQSNVTNNSASRVSKS